MIKCFKYTALFCLILLTFSCKKKEDLSYGTLTHDDVVSLNESSLANVDNINFNDVFVGKKGDQRITLELEKDGDFSLNVNGEKYEGKWTKLDDGTSIELDAEKGKPPYIYFAWAEGAWLILNPDGSYPENNQIFLNKQ